MNDTPPPSRAVLRRLILLLAFAAVLVIFSYGWTVTDIDFSVPQEPQRQQNVGNALRELLSPNVFTQEYDIVATTTSFTINCPEDFTPPEITGSDQPYIEVEPACGSANEPITVRGYNFAPNSLARVNWIATDGERRIRQVIGTNQDNFVTDSNGSFNVQVEIPRIRGSAGETHTVETQGRFPIGLPALSETTGLVAEKMVETIFLALIATSVSILPSAILSFLAARNLMRPVRMSLGNLLVAFILLPIGWYLGTALLSHIGMFALNLGRGSFLTGGVASVLVLLGMTASTRSFGKTDSDVSGFHPRATLNTLLMVIVAVTIIGLLGGLALLFASTLQNSFLSYVANFIGSLGQLVELGMIPITGLAGAYTLSSIGTSLTINDLKQISIPMSHILGGILGALAGAILLGLMATIGMSAAWLGLLTPVVAASLAASILPQLYRHFVDKPQQPQRTDQTMLSILSWLGAAIGFVITFQILNIRQAVVESTLPPQIPVAQFLDITIYNYVLQAMLIGLVLGGVTGALAGTKANFPIGPVLYTVTRTILNGLRSIEPLIMGLVFVIWVGIGPFAGVLALALHSVASLGKLYSEQIESIDDGPIEALQSTGANRLQTIMYAVVPQIIPPYIAFTMYRWDINVRMSTIIGFVGGGGIGFLLQQQINLLRYRDAGVAVLAIAIVVSILDYTSASIRERYI